MGVVDGAKAVADLARAYDKLDLYRKAVDLMAEVTELANQNSELQAEVRRLNELRTLRESLIFRMNTYWERGPADEIGNGPYCTNCFDTKDRLVRIHVWQGQYGPTAQCPACKLYVTAEWHPEHPDHK
jgi:hypothetical protein